VSGRNGMVAFGHEHDVIVAGDDGFVQPAIRRIDPLNGVALRFLELVKINLFQIRLEDVAIAVEAMLVVFVRRIRAPVSGRCINLDRD